MPTPPRKRRRTSAAAPAPAPEATLTARTLPSDLVLEIVARSDAATLVRCAACCKALRRDILSAAFIRSVCHGDGAGGAAAVVPPRLLGFLPCHDKYRQAMWRGSPPPAAFTLAHPATPAAARLSDEHLGPFLSRAGADLLACSYYPLTSRNGLVMLRRSKDASDENKNTPGDDGICVYDPMAGDRTFVPDPPEMDKYSAYGFTNTFVLLTASDGIGFSFLLLKADFSGLMYPGSSIKVQAVSSDSDVAGSKWSSVTSVKCNRSHGSWFHPYCSAVVLGGSVHWLMYGGSGRDYLHVLTYNVAAATAGRIDLPLDRMPKRYRNSGDGNLRLGSTPDGRLTMIFGDELKICIWLLAAEAGWTPHAVIDTEAPLRSLVPEVLQPYWTDHSIMRSWERSGVLLLKGQDVQGHIILDIETKEMHWVDIEVDTVDDIPFEVDLESWLSAMKTF